MRVSGRDTIGYDKASSLCAHEPSTFPDHLAHLIASLLIRSGVLQALTLTLYDFCAGKPKHDPKPAHEHKGHYGHPKHDPKPKHEHKGHYGKPKQAKGHYGHAMPAKHEHKGHYGAYCLQSLLCQCRRLLFHS